MRDYSHIYIKFIRFCEFKSLLSFHSESLYMNEFWFDHKSDKNYLEKLYFIAYLVDFKKFIISYSQARGLRLQMQQLWFLSYE